MTLDEGTAGAKSAPLDQPMRGRLVPQNTLGDRYIVEKLAYRGLWTEVYEAEDIHQAQPVSIHLVHPALLTTAVAREAFLRSAHRAKEIAHRSIVTVLDVAIEGEHGFVVTQRMAGTSTRVLLQRKAQSGGAGFGGRGALHIFGAVGDAVEAMHGRGLVHGIIAAESIYISDAGDIAITDLGLGALVAGAAQAGVAQAPPALAPEAAAGQLSPASDVYSAGRLLYEFLTGAALRRGGPRPSAVSGLPEAIDELITKAVSADPAQRFADMAAMQQRLREIMSGRSEAVVGSQPPAVAAAGPPAAVASGVSLADLAVDPALLADPTERWLVSKNRFDYGPYSTAELIDQMRAGEVAPGHWVTDNHSGMRSAIEDHPVLGPIVERASQLLSDQRRANAEVLHAKQEKRRGFALYGFIAGGIAALALIAYVVVTKARSQDDNQEAQAGVSAVGAGELQTKFSFASQKPDKKSGSGGGGSKRGGSGSSTLALDMADESGGSDRLGDDVISQIVQKNGSRLGGCLASNGGGYAKIEFIVDGPTGKVNWVQVNGQQSGGLYTCVNKAMRSIKFPSVNGARTRAEFEMEL